MQTTLETSHVTYCHMETTIRFQIPTFPFIQFKALGSIPPLGPAHSDFIERFWRAVCYHSLEGLCIIGVACGCDSVRWISASHCFGL